jgi:hypothetical protein
MTNRSAKQFVIVLLTMVYAIFRYKVLKDVAWAHVPL